MMHPEFNMDEQNDGTNYKKKYKTLKRKLKMLIYEQECFAEELRRAQRKLLRISRDKSFLLDRLMQYEKPEQKDSDSEATASSDSDNEPPVKKKKSASNIATPLSSEMISAMGASSSSGVAGMMSAPLVTLQQTKGKSAQKSNPVAMGVPVMPIAYGPMSSTPDSAKKKVKVSKKQLTKGVTKSLPAGMIFAPPPLASLSSSSSSSLPHHLAHAIPQFQTIVSQQQPTSITAAMAIQGFSPVKSGSGVGSQPQMIALTSPTKLTLGVSGVHQHYHHSMPTATRNIIAAGQTITMTQEELERHLELKQGNKPQFMNLEKTPMLPDNIFSNENSNSCDFPDNKTTDDEDLVIDMP